MTSSIPHEQSPNQSPRLTDLASLFFKELTELGEFREVNSDQMPASFRQLLAHDKHMTVTVEAYHKSLVDVVVLEVYNGSQKEEASKDPEEDSFYARKILLLLQNDQQIVQWGILRINLSMLSEEVRNLVHKKELPLGRILIEHRVLRKVELVKLWEIKPEKELREHFQLSPKEIIYGRTARILVAGKPAIELLEIVKS